MNPSNGYRWIMLGVMWLCAMVYIITFQSIPPILGILVHSLGISHAQAGGLMSLFILPGIFLSLPGGILLDRYGARIVGGTALLAMVVGTAIVALAHSYWVLGLGRLVTGIGGAFVLIVAPRVITAWSREREMALSMGVFNTAVPLGTILSLNFMGVIAYQSGWQVPIWVSFAICVVTLCLFLGLYRGGSDKGQTKAKPPALLTVLKKMGWGIWWVGASWMLFNAALLSFFTYAPDYFVTQGESVASAGRLASYPMWASIILAPIVGMLIDRIGRKWLFVAVGCGGMAILLYLMPRFISQATIIAIGVGIFVPIVTTAIFSLPPEILPATVIGFGFGILNTGLSIGVTLGPLLAGSLRDATGNYLWSFNTMAILAILGVIPMLLMKRRVGKIKQGNQG